jgi:hypothetical protein
MENNKETDLETAPKTRVRITTLTNRSSRVAAIRIALIQKKGQDFLVEEVADKIMEEGCRKLEQELGIKAA